MSVSRTSPSVAESGPATDILTDNDRAHLRLLEAQDEGAEWWRASCCTSLPRLSRTGTPRLGEQFGSRPMDGENGTSISVAARALH
jgi:hypothetical protein